MAKIQQYLTRPTIGFFVAPGAVIITWIIPDVPMAWLSDEDRGWRKANGLLNVVCLN